MEPLSPPPRLDSLGSSPRHARWHRREALKLAGLAGSGWLTWLAHALASDTEQPATRPSARSLIYIWLAGGPSQLETFDPHPGTAIGGDTRAIATREPGIALADGLEQLADVMNSVSLVRVSSSQPAIEAFRISGSLRASHATCCGTGRTCEPVSSIWRA